ncbi:MAG: DUF1565 domain-containing protein, partial [Cytophagales bacterium]|nr:DUF1565 domain-containing protein [Cytophagales bacterium]
MKKLITTRPRWAGQRLPFFLIFFFSLHLVFADTFYVSTTGNDSNDGSQARPWRTVAKAAASVPAGSHTIVVAAGTYDEGVMELKPGVSLQGAGRDRTIIRNRTFDWWRGALRLNSTSVTAGNQTVSALTLDGISAAGFEGIQILNRTGVKLLDIKVQNFFHCGVDVQASPGMTVRDIEIANFELNETARESGGGSYGAITVRGNMENLYFHDGVIYHQTNRPVGPTSDRSSGYAMKFFPTFSNGGFNNNTEYISKTRIQRIRDIGKPTAAWGNNVPNIGIEFWNIGGSEVEISDCDFTTHLSLEFNPATHKGRYSFWVRNNRFAVGSGQSIELAVSNAIVEGNTFDYRSNTNAWNVIGEYNDKPRGAGNIGNSSPILWSIGNPATGLYFYNNTVCGSAGAGMFRFDPGVSNDLRVLNNAFDLGNGVSLCSYWSSATPPTGLTVAN